MKEAAVVIDKRGEAIYWHVPEDRTSVALPDSKDLWQFIWDNRDKIHGVAHSHPGRGEPTPSTTDLTTFRAIDAALGMKLSYLICSEDSLVLCSARLFDDYRPLPIIVSRPWLEELRRISYSRETKHGRNRKSGTR